MLNIKRLVAVAAVATVATIGCQSTTSGGHSQEDTEFSAKDTCNNFVKDRLKSPATAHFNEDTALGGGSSWTVSGTVDSENGFGAQLRSSFTCTMTLDGDTWHLKNLQFDDGGDISN